MEIYVALLRGVNVGGNKKISMGELRDDLISAGYEDVRTVLQSGNVVLRGRGKSCVRLESELKRELQTKFKIEVDFLVRTADEFDAVIEANPFSQEAREDPGHLLTIFLKEPPDHTTLGELQASWDGPEYFQAVDRQIYAVFPDGIGHSKLITNATWKKLAAHGSGRNWNTVLKLAALTRI